MPIFATFPPGLPNNVPAMVLPDLGHWGYGHTLSTPTVSVDTISNGMAKELPCIAEKSVQKLGTILPLSNQPL